MTNKLSKRYLLGYDLGSSSVKASLVDTDTGSAIANSISPKNEMAIQSPFQGWAEQDPELWWKHIISATAKLIQKSEVSPDEVAAIGISYQMHGLVVVDKNHHVLRPSIIWCDSRAAGIGQKAFQGLGKQFSLEHFLNSPGNFTASKLKWVKDNEPEIYKKIFKMMLPGDFIAMKMTGKISTTVSGLSEGILWDYRSKGLAGHLLDHYELPAELIPNAHNSFEIAGELTTDAAGLLGLKAGIPISYRAGDQPNNAFSLNVLKKGEMATTAGTSGVIYAVTEQPLYDRKSRVNSFIHVNHQADNPSYGVLLCLNGTGILNSWIKHQLMSDQIDYPEMNKRASSVPIGSDGLYIFPFGNGSERILENQNTGSVFYGLDFNRHQSAHIMRAAQEGIVFALNYGFKIMKQMGVQAETVKAGHSNMFLSPLFREAFVNTTNTVLKLYRTDGAEGAARGAGIGAGIFKDYESAFKGLTLIDTIYPEKVKIELYKEAGSRWLQKLNNNILTRT
ncbi:MAG: FGGY family carbohydrate kinase [Balneolaceae bacterium]